MKSRTLLTIALLIFTGVSVVYAVMKEARAKSTVATSTSAETKQSNPQALKHKVIAYYFHGIVRCPSCMKIEAYSAETIKSRFADKLKEGLVEWQVVNIDEPQNQHFVHDYKLVTKSLVLVDVNDGKYGKWKNLEKVWDFLGNKDNFSTYVETELKGFLKGG
jgi:hypothetical protein